MSIRLRLTLWYSGLLAAVLIGFGLLIYSVVYNSTMSDIRGELAKLSANMRVQAKIF
ncbi:hypothetical protein [Cohnella faecalis]|nr:hypothetical protein [Cohnella faecalis]